VCCLIKCVCPLQIVYAYCIWLLGASPPDPHRDLPLDPAGDFRPPNPLCPPYLQTLATQPRRSKVEELHNAVTTTTERMPHFQHNFTQIFPITVITDSSVHDRQHCSSSLNSLNITRSVTTTSTTSSTSCV